MNLRLMEAELFHADGRTDGQTWQSYSGFPQRCERALKGGASVATSHYIYFLGM